MSDTEVVDVKYDDVDLTKPYIKFSMKPQEILNLCHQKQITVKMSQIRQTVAVQFNSIASENSYQFLNMVNTTYTKNPFNNLWIRK